MESRRKAVGVLTQKENKKIILFANLEPRKLRGITSQGMLLAAINSDESKVVLIKPKLNVSAGEKIYFKDE